MEVLKGAGAMFLEASGGAVLGSSCDSFLESMEKYCMLDEPVLDRVRSVVENFELYVPKMEEYMGDRQAELLEELKEEVKRGRELLTKLEANDSSWFKARDNKQLTELDASLKSLIRKLRLQSAVDVKEVLLLEKENAEVVKSTKRKVEVVMNMMKKQRKDDSANQVGELVEGAALGAALEELDLLAEEETLKSVERPYRRKHWWKSLVYVVKEQTGLIFDWFETTKVKRQERLYMPVLELKEFRMSVEDGVALLRECPTIQEWTDELKDEYTNKFLALENTLKVLYNRLPGLRPLKWSCRKCDKSLGAASTSFGDSAGFAIQGN